MSLCKDSVTLVFNGTRATETLSDQVIASGEVYVTNTNNEEYVIESIDGFVLNAGENYTLFLPADVNLTTATVSVIGYSGGYPGGTLEDVYFTGTPNGIGIPIVPTVDIDALRVTATSIGGQTYNQTISVTGDLEVNEELTVSITKYCIDPSPLYPVETYDSRNDTEFEFSPLSDGAYKVQYIGAISGVIEEEDVLVKLKAENELGRIAKRDVNTLMTGDCVNDEYMFKKSLICMAEKMFGCERNCEAEQYLLKVLEDDCGNIIEDCGCS